MPVIKLIPLVSTVAQTPVTQSLGVKRSPHPSSITPDLRWSRVEEYFRSRELQPNTRKSYEREFKAFLTWTEKGWQDITPRDLDRYKDYLKLQPSARGRKRATATINLALSALQSLFKWLCARDYISKDPMLLLEKPKSAPIQSQEWSADEVQRLFAAIQQRGKTAPRDRALLWVLLHGLRAGEVEALNLVDFDGQRLHIREAKDDSVGRVPLLPAAIAVLETYLQQRQMDGEDLEQASPLFLSESNNSKGQRLSYWGIYKVVKELAAIAGVKDAHPHRGRHTVATEMVSRGMNPLLARQITRHKSEKSFERYSQRALQKQAEVEFLEVFGRADEHFLPRVIAAEADSDGQELQRSPIRLQLKIRSQEGGSTAKVRRAIEQECLARFHMQKLERNGYRLVIPHEENLARQIEYLRGEITELVEEQGCWVEAVIQEEATMRQ
jgi:integrase/recombinase XerD